MILGAVTYDVLKDWDLETILTKLPELGYAAVELRTTHKHGVEPALPLSDRELVARRFQKAGLRLLSYGTVCEFHAPDAAVRRQNIESGKQWVDLAHDTGAIGIKVRPNGFPKELPREETIQNIASALRELGDFGVRKGVEIWVEVHGAVTQEPANMAAILRATRHDNVGLCWNSNPTDVANGSVKESFALLRPWIKNVHINELTSGYPYRELFRLLQESKYSRYILCECQASKEPERFLKYYRALFNELVKGR
jgi:sugar phosphate isomerase/epimerase